MFCILVFLVTYYNMYSIGEVKTIMCHPSFDHLIVRFNGKAKLAKYVLTAGSSSATHTNPSTVTSTLRR